MKLTEFTEGYVKTVSWEFKDIISYQGKNITQDSRKFEILLEEYLNSQYPLQNWKLTKSTGDNNRDLITESEFSGESMWAEAKFTIHTDQNLSSRKYDSTLVSSVFEQNLIKIFFITNTSVNSQLIGRIKNFYYLFKVKQIAFVDGYTLLYWLKKNPQIEEKYFKNPLVYTMPSSPSVNLKCVRILCKNDSYTISSLLEEEEIYPLYLSNNYIIEGEFIAFGFESTPLTLYCNGIVVYQDTVLPEITTFTIDLNSTGETFNANEELILHLYHIVNEERQECGDYHLKFSVMGELYRKQVEIYKTIENGIKFGHKKIYNIFGPEKSGKSLLLTNLKNDLLKSAVENQRIIYVHFIGVASDISDICRIVFTLIFDYYNLTLSAAALSAYCNDHSVRNSILNSHNIETLIQALRENNYSLIQSILKGAALSKSEVIFEIQQSFNYKRIYFIDNINRLSSDNLCILQAILRAFESMENVIFVLTADKEFPCSYVENLPLGYINDREILAKMNERVSFQIDDLSSILPQEHYLKYPGLLHSFLQNINDCKSNYDIQRYYIDSFHSIGANYITGCFPFENFILLLICFVREGIPTNLLENIDKVMLSELFNKQLVVRKNDCVYPRFERWDNDIPDEIIKRQKENIENSLKSFMLEDAERKEIYQCALMTYYPEYYMDYFSSVFACIKQKYNENKYSQVIFMSDLLIRKKNFYTDDQGDLNYVKYYLAFSFMHCNASKRANEIFQEILDYYEIKDKVPLYFDAKAEMIDAQYWNFDQYKELPICINSFRRVWKETQPDIPDLQTRSYLTATNRMMVTYLALDNIAMADKWFRKNLKLAGKYHAPEHLGYTYMDYAKGIYHKDLTLALKYLQLADKYFQEESEKRRHLDCQCEIQYVELLRGSGSIQRLLEAQSKLFEHQYWIQYYKCDLKLAVCYILRGDRRNAQRYLLEAKASEILKGDERVLYLRSIIETCLYHKRISYENKSLAGTSYQQIIDNMQYVNGDEQVELYSMGNNDKIFYIDPRVW